MFENPARNPALRAEAIEFVIELERMYVSSSNLQNESNYGQHNEGSTLTLTETK